VRHCFPYADGVRSLINPSDGVRTVPTPTWVKVAVDAWTSAAAVIDGRVFRSVSRADRAQGEGLSEKVVWQLIKLYGGGIDNLKRVTA